MKFSALFMLLLLTCALSAQDIGTLYNTARELYLKGEYEKGIPYAEKVVEMGKTELGEQSTEYGTCINLLGLLYVRTGNYKRAEPLFYTAKEIKRKLAGEEDAEHITISENLVWVYSKTGQYKKAEPLYLWLAEVKAKLLGENDPAYAAAINDLATAYLYMGEYKKAEPLFQRSLLIRKNTLGENHADYASSLDNLASLYSYMNLYEKAEPLYLQSIAIRKAILPETHEDFTTGLNNLASLYLYMAQYARAESLYFQALRIRQKIPGENSPEYALSLNNLASLYLYTSEYAKAEPLYLQSRNIRERVWGREHPEYITSLNNLAELYSEMGQYEKAIPLYEQVILTRKKILGENHSDYATSLNNFGLFLQKVGLYKEALEFCTQASEIRKSVLGENDADYAVSLNNVALLLKVTGQPGKAEANYLQAEKIIGSVLGADHPQYATTLNNLGQFYNDLGQYAKAETYYNRAKDIRKKTLGESSVEYARSLDNLAFFYTETGRCDKAETFRLQANRLMLKSLLSTFTILSEKEKSNYLDNNITLVETNNSFLYNYPGASAAFIKNNFNLQLFMKSLSLAATKNMLEAVRRSGDTAVRRIFSTWQTYKRIITKEYSLPLEKQRSDLKKIESAAEEMEKELTRRSSQFRDQQNALQVSVKEVYANLQPGEAAVEFVRFRLLRNSWTDSMMYAAYVLTRQDSVPRFVPLCEERQLQQLFDTAGKTASGMVGSFYRGLEGKSKTVPLGNELYDLIWQPLEPQLKGIKKIAYSPAGKLFSVAFHALPASPGDSPDSNQILSDKYFLEQLTSTRQIALRKNQEARNRIQGIALFGDPAFNMDSVAMAHSKIKNQKASAIYTPPKRGNQEGNWAALPGTGEEVKKIKALFDANKISTKSFVQTAASEENLKTLSDQSPPVLHIATHGFFLPYPEENRQENKVAETNTYSLANDPLLRSGLILAGGNYAWSGKPPVEGVEDGIVTAYEISQLNLSHTELVVLSACETALGDVKGSEGVFGLQRAFKMAGAKKMIVSLWQVPDKETAELMTGFYGYWLKGQKIEEAFTRAQADMRKKYSPFYWAAFVLVE